MRMFIPTIGFTFRLVEDWDFACVGERRNYSFLTRMGVPGIPPTRSWERSGQFPVVIPQGTILKINRVYIRKNAPNFDSVTFHVVSSPILEIVSKKNGGTGESKAASFWAKLPDVNNIQFEAV